MDGKVKWFSNEQGYGYIVAEDGGEHYFKIRDVRGVVLPKNGDVVQFESRINDIGLYASGIIIVDSVNSDIEKDDRALCLNCGKRMVPRLQYARSAFSYSSDPINSICPYCSFVYRDFGTWNFILTSVYCFFVSFYLKGTSKNHPI